MGQVRMFRDRVVSMEQTQEIGEKNIDLLTALAVEALPGFALREHGLEHEQDLYVLTLVNADSGETRSVAFTRMVLSDAERLPAIVADGAAPIRACIVDLIRSRAGRRRIVVAMRELQTEDERVEADAIEAEWRVKHEAALAAKRAEDERRQRERQRQKQQQEDARRQAQREREKRQRSAQGGGSHAVPQGHPAPAAQPGEGGGRRRRRRGRGGQNRGNAPGVAQQPDAQAQAQGPRPEPQRPAQPRPQPRQEKPAGEAGGPRPEGGGRRRRRRGRGRGGNAAGGAPPAPSVL